MPQIFVSYSKHDRARVESLVHELQRQGWSVWWDPQIPPGKRWDEVVEDALRRATCVVVIWTPASVTSEWVRNEAADAKTRGILVPVILEPVMLPLEFRRVEACDLSQWQPGDRSSEFDLFLSAITNLTNSKHRETDTQVPPVIKKGTLPLLRITVALSVMLLLAITLFAVLQSPRGEESGDDGGGATSSTSTTGDTATAPTEKPRPVLTATVWLKNWQTVTPTNGLPFMSNAGEIATNREQFIDILTALDLSEAQDLIAKRDEMLQIVRTAPATSGDPTYNISVPRELQSDYYKLRDAIRNRAIAAGVAITEAR